jgi:hypothetical protein
MRVPIHRLVFRPTLSHRSRQLPKGSHGYYEYRKRLIALDPRSRELLSTYLHELLHMSHPDWSEAAVAREEKRRWKKMTWKDKARLAQALGKGRCG